MNKMKQTEYKKGVLVVFTLFLYSGVILCQSGYTIMNTAGDFIIGAMIPIRNIGQNGECGDDINDQDGIQMLEALLYSLDRVNAEVLKESNITLGVMALGTCYNANLKPRMVLEFGDEQRKKSQIKGKLIGIIEALTSVESIAVAKLILPFKIPQISSTATSPELSDKYEYFMRTVSSDIYQAEAIVQLLKALHWTYVTGVYEDTSYGQLGFKEVKKQAKLHDICIAEAFQVKSSSYSSTLKESNEELLEVITTLTKYTNTEGKIIVILYMSKYMVERLFELMVNMSSFEVNKYMWIGSDAWVGRNVKVSHQYIADNSYGIQAARKEVRDFDVYFQSLKPATEDMRNIWFTEYWEQLFSCSVQNHSDRTNWGRNCTGNETISTKAGTYNKNKNTYLIMDAVFAVGYALKALHKDVCNGKPSRCGSLSHDYHSDIGLIKYLQNVIFNDPAGMEFRFYGNSGAPRYSIIHFMNTSQGYLWHDIGNFTGSSKDSRQIQFYGNGSSLFEHKPSFCSAPCKEGEVMSFKSTCCWSCISCTYYQYINTSEEMCIDCPKGQLPDKEHSECLEIPETTMDFTHALSITVFILSIMGVLLTVLVAIVFYRNRSTPIIMASGKELSSVLLFGIFLSYLSSFVYVVNPTPISCGTTRLLFGLCYTICYAAIAVKTNRIYRLFNSTTNTAKRASYVNAKSQLLITLAIVMIQVAALTVWLIGYPAKVVYIYPTRGDNVRVCEDSQGFAYLGVLAYPFIILLVCVVYAVKTRHTPDGFNETRYIAFCSYSICIMWITFISIFFSVTDKNTIRIGTLCFTSTMNATVTLITLFITKAYVVIFHPQHNTKKNVMSRERKQLDETVDTVSETTSL